MSVTTPGPAAQPRSTRTTDVPGSTTSRPTTSGRATDAHGPALSAGVGRAIRYGQITLLAVGLALLAWGAYVMFDTVRLPRITGLAIWIVAAIILHDAILAPVLFGAGLLLRRAGQKVPGTVIAVVQGTLVVGSMVSLIVVPILVAQNFTPNNPSILPLNYGLNLGIFWLVLLLLGSGLSVWLYLRARRANERPSSSQD
ncbi:hypothetical protein E3T55_06200 [Cryobacterium frigoriphilum]|uniref:Uncharacterized protein n=1 Tax=Cryobacterium frigoriphilum TaxID=1259150 RepID=A0A4R9A677_9MICO|nr:hypothetical protein [Cryobacterium frigoriphilum]TFD52686.1 hypothetical protein E3T55_06200 [Cryobacterium frigoriphilum]